MVQNIYNQSSSQFQNAGNLLQQAMQMFGQIAPMSASTYNPAMMNAASAGPASLMTAAQTANPALIAAGMKNYQNPYENNVVQRTAADINRMTNVQQNQNAASAANAGAFGGSRHGIVEAITNSEGQKNMGDFAANLRHQGFNTAANLSAQDVQNLMNTGQFNAGLTQQGRMQNQNALNNQSQFNAGLTQQGRMQNQGAANNAGQFNAGAQNAASQFNVNTQLAQAGGMAGLSPMASNLGTSMFNVGQSVTGDQAAAGALQQQLIQGILGGAQGQYGQFMGQPANVLNMLVSALSGNPLQNATTTTQSYKPGALDWASLIGQFVSNIWPKPGGGTAAAVAGAP